MIPLVEGMKNTIKIVVDSSINIEGFTAVLASCGVLKTIPDLTSEEIKVEFSEEEVVNISENGTYCTLEVYDGAGDLYVSYLPEFYLIPQSDAPLAKGNQTLYLTVVSTRNPNNSSGGGESEYATREELEDAIRNIEEIQGKVEHAAETHLTSHLIDEDGDGQPDDETIYFHPEAHN